MAGQGPLQAPEGCLARPSALRAARRPAVCQRRHPHRPRGQQDPQGHHRQVEAPRGVRCAVCPGLGLPRHAHRGADREGARPQPLDGRDAEAVPRLRDRTGRAPEEGLPAPGRARRLGQPVPDDGSRQRGRRDPHARHPAAEGLHLPRPEAGELVLRLRLGAGRGRGRVRGPQGPRRRCRVCLCGAREAGQGFRPARLAGQARAYRDLDDDPVDAAGQPGAQRASRVRLHPRRHGKRAADPCGGIAGEVPRALPAHWHDARHLQGRGARPYRVPAPVLRPPLAGVSRRLRHARHRHGHRALVARLRRGGLRFLPPQWPQGRRDPHAGDGRRQVRVHAAALRRPDDLEGQPEGRRGIAAARCAVRERILRPQLHALLAAQDAGDPARHDPVVRGHGKSAGLERRETVRVVARHCAARRREHAVLPGLGPGAPARHDRQPARLDAVAPAAVGRADAVLPPSRDGAVAPAHAGTARADRQACREGRYRCVAAHHG